MNHAVPRATILSRFDRLLVVQTAFLGDVVMTLPLLRLLRRTYPDAELTLFARHAGAALISGQGVVDRCVGIDKEPASAAIAGRFGQVRRAVQGRFDGVICAQRSVHTGLIALAARAPVRVGFAGAPGAFAYTHRVDLPRSEPATERYLGLAEAVGARPLPIDSLPRLDWNPAAGRRVDAMLAASGVAPGSALLVLAPGSVRRTKRWPSSRFAEVASGALRRGLVPVVVGVPNERDIEEQILRTCGAGAVGLTGRTTVDDLVALVARAQAVVANDSGPAHLAAATGVATLVVFGPTGPAQGLAPVGARVRYLEHPSLACRPCHRHGPRRCPERHFRCMQELSGGTALEALEDLGAFDRSAIGSSSGPFVGRQALNQDSHRTREPATVDHVS